MSEGKGRILLVTEDKALSEELARASAARNLELVEAAADAAAARVSEEGMVAVVWDMEHRPQTDREVLAAAHPGGLRIPIFILESRVSLAPDAPAPLRHLTWPLPAGFGDQLRATDRPVVLLSDQTLFTTAALQVALQQAGVQIVALESAHSLVEFLREQQEARTPKPRPKSKKSFWERLGAEDKAQSADDSRPVLGHVVVVMFPGSVVEAEALDTHVREAVPEAVCYSVSSSDLGRAVAPAIKENRCVSLMRDAVGRIPGLLAAASETEKSPSKDGGRILLVDNYKPTLAA
jgi:hypothetical protein